MAVSPQTALQLAQAILAVHIAIAGFVIFGIVAIPLGARLGWQFVYNFWWRLIHVGAMGIIALQKLMGNSCFLSVWEFRLVDIASKIPHPTPVFQTIGEHVLYWNLPLWFFAALYTALFVFVVLMWFIVPPTTRGASKPALLHFTRK
jgi:Protein of Unknown function (DUF2784)